MTESVADQPIDELDTFERRKGAWRKSWKIRTGFGLLGLFVLMAVVGPMVAPYDPSALSPDVLAAPSSAHWLGTTNQGQDVLSQILVGARMSLQVGFLAALISELLAILVGVTSGYLTGVADEVLSVITNVFLVIPVLPLQILIIAYLGDLGWVLMAVVIGVTHWAHSARKLRAQTLSMRRREFIVAARAAGEARRRIILFEILPNEAAIIASGFLFAVLSAIIVQTGLSFLGLGDISTWSWGAILYWAERDSAFLIGAWWWYVPPGLCLALVGMGLALLNLGIDEMVNPRLRSVPGRKVGRDRPASAAEPPRPVAVSDGPVPGGEPGAGTPLLEIKNLTVDYATEGAPPVHAVRDVSLTIRRGEVLGIAGESGSGKSTLAYAITKLLRLPGRVTGGEVLYHGDTGTVDVLALQHEHLRQFRWEHVSVVFQAAMSSLNPIMTVRAQLADTIMAHRPDWNSSLCQERIDELIHMVGLTRSKLDVYPHQLSGGQRQRVVIAMALALEPRLVVLDEPTTALDVVVQRRILDGIIRLRAELDCTFVFITHDLSLLLEVADRIAVMYAGEIVEVSAATERHRAPSHPYTQALLRSFPTLQGERRQMLGLPGTPPDLRRLAAGCPFHPRCAEAMERCTDTAPTLQAVAPGHWVSCLRRMPEATAGQRHALQVLEGTAP